MLSSDRGRSLAPFGFSKSREAIAFLSLEQLSNDGALSLDGVTQAPFQVFTGAVGSTDQLLLAATDSDGNTSSATVNIAVSSSMLPDLTTNLVRTSDYTTGNPSTTFSSGSLIGINFDEI